jgi:hypothetical protein
MTRYGNPPSVTHTHACGLAWANSPYCAVGARPRSRTHVGSRGQNRRKSRKSSRRAKGPFTAVRTSWKVPVGVPERCWPLYMPALTVDGRQKKKKGPAWISTRGQSPRPRAGPDRAVKCLARSLPNSTTSTVNSPPESLRMTVDGQPVLQPGRSGR